jgi:uncharacterized protein (DUF1501 family)
MKPPQSTRRQFLAKSIASAAFAPVAANLIVGGPQDALAQKAPAALPTLVVIRLAGGNDGLNTVIPFADEPYFKARPRLAIPADKVILNDRLGLHPALVPFKPLFDAEQFAVIQGVGFPDQPKSHTAAAIWDNGRLDLSNPSDGWLRWPALRAPLVRADWKARFDAIAAAIGSQPTTRVHFAALAGFDTHVGQAGRHARALAALAESVVAFWNQLAEQSAQSRVAILIHSEFGRTLAENGMGGTDHGSAGPVLLIAPNVKARVVGTHPSLTDLDAAGALKHTVDFRSVYATLLTGWLKVPYQPIVGSEIKSLPLFGI